MGSGKSKASANAEKYFLKNQDSSAKFLSEKFKIDTSTIYRSKWWKDIKGKK